MRSGPHTTLKYSQESNEYIVYGQRVMYCIESKQKYSNFEMFDRENSQVLKLKLFTIDFFPLMVLSWFNSVSVKQTKKFQVVVHMNIRNEINQVIAAFYCNKID